MKSFSFVGFGAWGGALSIHLARHGISHIFAWEYLPSVRDAVHNTGFHPNLGDHGQVPDSIRIIENLEDLPWKKSVVFLAVASDHLIPTLQKIRAVHKKAKPHACVILTKGMEPATMAFFSERVPKELGLSPKDVFILSGPTIAKELLAGAPTLAVLAGAKGSKQSELVKLLSKGNFNVEPSQDARGAQTGGSMKNVYAIGYGILEALDAPANTRAFYFLRALEEMKLMNSKLGGKLETVYGPAGLGDLLTTSLSTNSRNSRLGRMLAEGKPLDEIQLEIGMATEGVKAAELYIKLAKQKRIHLPLAQSIHKVLTGSFQAQEFLLGLK